MASINETKKALESHFATNWTATTIQWPPVAYDPRKNASGESLPYVTFIQKETQYPGGGNVTLGSPLASRFFRWSGIIVNEVFVPANHLDAGLMTRYVGMIIDIFAMQTLLYDDSNGDQCTCRLRVPWATEVGVVNGWHLWNVTTSYLRDAPS